MPPSTEPPEPELPDAPACTVCGTPLAAMHCPRCLLNLATNFGVLEDFGSDTELLDAHQVRQFGDYELLEEIARGGMGVVYRAHQVSLNREVAIKMVLAGELAGSTVLRMFQIEAHAAANLHHPNIVPVYEIGEHQTQHYFTMRFVPGGRTIAGWASERRKEFREIAAAVAKVARAVAHAHAHSVLHRDLKPSNILWDDAAGPQVTDFGLAKLLDEVDPDFTRAIEAMGSPSYMAPEQIIGKVSEITTAADVYGLGAVLYELLAGRPAFGGATPMETMRQVADVAPAPVPGVPLDLWTICLKCLEKRPEHRYSSAAGLAEDLERFAQGEPVSVVPLTLPQITWRWAQRQPRTAALIALCLFLFLAGVVGIAWQWRNAERARIAQAKALEHLRWQEIDRWLEEGDASRALAYLAGLIRERPSRWQAVMYAMSIVEQNPFPVLVGPEIHPPVKLVGSARLAPSGKWLAAAGEDKVVRIWEPISGKETGQMAQASPVTALAVAEGPIVLAVATEDGRLQVWPSLTAPPKVLERPAGEKIRELSFSADGSHLMARAKERLEVWSVSAMGDAPLTCTAEEELRGAAISADGARVLGWSAKGAAVWDTRAGQQLWNAQSPKRFLQGIISVDGLHVALLDGGFTARVWDLESEQPSRPIESPLAPFSQMAFNAAGTRLTLAGVSNKLMVVDVAAAIPVSPPMEHHYVVTDLESSADGSLAFSHGWDDDVKAWSTDTGVAAMNTIHGAGGGHRGVTLSPSRDGKVVLVHTPPTRETPESLAVWRGTQRHEPLRKSFAGERDFDSSEISADGKLGILGLVPGYRTVVYELSSGRVRFDKPAAGPVYVSLLSSDGRKLYTCTANGWLYGWSLDTGEALWPPNQQPGLIRPMAPSPDGTRLIIGHNDGHIRVHDTATGELVQTLDHPGEVKVLRFAPDGSGRFVSGSTDRLAHIWDLRTGKMLQTLTGHEGTVLSAAWSPDGREVATASYDETARVWDAATGKPVCPPLREFAWLSHLEFSPDGRLLATACRDGTARLWNPASGQPASLPLHQRSTCDSVRFTADGKSFLIRDHEGFRFWDTENGEPITVYCPEPEASGVGIDGESYRSMMTADGTGVFLGRSMNEGAFWSVSQPREPAPPWLADFLEILAQVRLEEHGDLRLVPRAHLAALKALVRGTPATDFYATWARGILGPDGL